MTALSRNRPVSIDVFSGAEGDLHRAIGVDPVAAALTELHAR